MGEYSSTTAINTQGPAESTRAKRVHYRNACWQAVRRLGGKRGRTGGRSGPHTPSSLIDTSQCAATQLLLLPSHAQTASTRKRTVNSVQTHTVHKYTVNGVQTHFERGKATPQTAATLTITHMNTAQPHMQGVCVQDLRACCRCHSACTHMNTARPHMWVRACKSVHACRHWHRRRVCACKSVHACCH